MTTNTCMKLICLHNGQQATERALQHSYNELFATKIDCLIKQANVPASLHQHVAMTIMEARLGVRLCSTVHLSKHVDGIAIGGSHGL